LSLGRCIRGRDPRVGGVKSDPIRLAPFCMHFIPTCEHRSTPPPGGECKRAGSGSVVGRSGRVSLVARDRRVQYCAASIVVLGIFNLVYELTAPVLKSVYTCRYAS
jgi:hypothetical protein